MVTSGSEMGAKDSPLPSGRDASWYCSSAGLPARAGSAFGYATKTAAMSMPIRAVFNASTARDRSRLVSPLPSLPGLLLSVIGLLLVGIGGHPLEKKGRLSSPRRVHHRFYIGVYTPIRLFTSRCSLRRHIS